MKKAVFLLALGLAAGFSFAAQAGSPPCGSADGPTANDCARDDFASADAELNRVYRQVLQKHADNRAFTAKLRTAQRRWLAFRDAHLGARFPLSINENPRVRYGSVYTECHMREATSLTLARIEQLKKWLEDVPEGEVCIGSYSP